MPPTGTNGGVTRWHRFELFEAFVVTACTCFHQKDAGRH
jgi:hypothetical protein